MACCQRIHIDQEHLAVLQFQVPGMIVSVDHMVIMRHILHQPDQFGADRRIELFLYKTRPDEGRILHVRQLSLWYHSTVDLPQHLDIFFHAPVHLLRLSSQDPGKRSRVQKFEYGTVMVAHFDDIIGDRCRDPEDQRQLGHFPLMPDLLKRILVVVHLDHIILIDPVDGSVRTAADLLAAFDADDTVGLLHHHDLGEARHIKDLVDFRADARDLHLRPGLLHSQQDPQTCTGNVVKRRCVDHHRCLLSVRKLRSDLFFHCRRIVGIDPAVQNDPDGFFCRCSCHVLSPRSLNSMNCLLFHVQPAFCTDNPCTLNCK